MADPARGSKATIPPDSRTHEFVGMKAFFHQGFRLAGLHQGHGLVGSLMAVCRLDDAEPGTILLESRSGGQIFSGGPTRIGSMICIEAADRAAPSEASSQGCATSSAAMANTV